MGLGISLIWWCNKNCPEWIWKGLSRRGRVWK